MPATHKEMVTMVFTLGECFKNSLLASQDISSQNVFKSMCV